MNLYNPVFGGFFLPTFDHLAEIFYLAESKETELLVERK